MAGLTTRFGPFLLDSDTRQLVRDGHALSVSPKAFDLLATLIEARPRIVSKSALQQRLWPATFVAEANLSNLVAELRKVLGDRPQASLFIRTAHGFGYAFCSDAEVVNGVGRPRRRARAVLAGMAAAALPPAGGIPRHRA